MRRTAKAKAKKAANNVKDLFSRSRPSPPGPRHQAEGSSSHEAVAGPSIADPDQHTTSVPREDHHRWDRIRAVLNDALKVAEKAGSPFPGASMVFGGLVMVFEAIDKIHANSSTVVELQERVDSLLEGFNNAQKSESPPGLVDDVKRMIALLGGFFERMKKTEDGSWKRLMDRNIIDSDLASISKRIDSAVMQFITNSTIRLEEQIQSGELTRLLDTLPRVSEASHISWQSDARSRCFEDTRAEVINGIEKWANSPDPKAPSVFWLNGMAGIGKSTVAQSISERAYDQGILGASFFFSRNKSGRNGTKLVIPTLAYQLALTSPELKYRIGAAIQKDPMVGERSVLDQLKKLIIDPLNGMDRNRPAVLIVLDALDECGSREHAKELLKLFVTSIPQIPFPFRVLITSRPEPHISGVLKSATDDANIVLHDIEKSVVKKDITRYLEATLADIVKKFSLHTPWPNAADAEALADKAGKLFIYAITCIRFLSDDVVRNPKLQLETLLRPSQQRGTSAHADLDLLYDQILSSAVRTLTGSNPRPPINKYVLDRYQMVVGTIVLLRDPLPVRALARILGHEEGVVREALYHLQSVIIVPSSDSEPLSMYHPSFPDFITDPDRCTDAQLRIDRITRERQLTIQCLELLNTELRRDIADIRDPSLMNEDVIGLQERVNEVIPAELHYACVYWTEHLCSLESKDEEVMKPLGKFVTECMLWWFESLSLLENVAFAVTGLRDAHQWAIKAGCDDEITSLLYDGYRFILAHSDVVSTAALHVYYSALPFAPHQSKIWKWYENEVANSTRILLGPPPDWSPCLRVFNNHSREVTSVAFSADGRYLASGSADTAVRLWDVATGMSTARLEGHSNYVRSVAFSTDGRHLASGSADKTVRLWDVATGKSIATLEGHSKWVTSVAFSTDGRHLASGSNDKTVRLWDVATGKSTARLEGHFDYVTSVAFSTDGRHLASGSDDRTVRLWDVTTGKSTARLEGHSGDVTSVAFSTDGRHLASGSADETVRLWDVATGKSTATLEGHSHWVRSVAFSTDGRHLASGAADKTVRLWDVSTGKSTATLEGHSDSVMSVAFSTDGRHLASGSDDNTVCLWDVSTGKSTATSERHSDYLRTVAFSTDGRHLASGAADKTARIWDVATGKSTATLEGHSGDVTSVAFSTDGRHLASGSYDKTVRLWDVTTGKSTARLKGHFDYVRSVAFSTDGRHLASGSDDRTVRLWDIATGKSTVMLQGHSDSVASVAFSANGNHVISRSIFSDIKTWDVFSHRSAEPPNTSTSHVEIVRSEPCQLRMEGQWLSCQRPSTAWSHVCKIPGEYLPAYGSFTQLGYRVAVGCLGGQVLVLDAEPLLRSILAISSHES